MPRIEVTSSSSEVAYYASLEVRGLPRPADLAKTRRFKKPPPIPQLDPPTTKFERCDDPVTMPFLKESAPYELIDIQDAPAEAAQEGEPVDIVDIDLESMELIAASDLLAGDTIRSAGPLFEQQPRSLRWVVIGLVLFAAFVVGIALAYLALR
ncbi:MAG: hypothetical protein H0V17_34455 [Deltaproteobacteria bacterium]|nr:hypothetical protein [Deltaproteobacteria bacterium]